jgi:hypothetical protein
VNRLAGPWLMELDDALAVSAAATEGDFWDRLAAQLVEPADATELPDVRPPQAALCRRHVVADVERLVGQLISEVDRLLERFDPALASPAGNSASWTKAQRASLLAHASSALIERGDTPYPERR